MKCKAKVLHKMLEDAAQSKPPLWPAPSPQQLPII